MMVAMIIEMVLMVLAMLKVMTFCCATRRQGHVEELSPTLCALCQLVPIVPVAIVAAISIHATLET